MRQVIEIRWRFFHCYLLIVYLWKDISAIPKSCCNLITAYALKKNSLTEYIFSYSKSSAVSCVTAENANFFNGIVFIDVAPKTVIITGEEGLSRASLTPFLRCLKKFVIEIECSIRAC